MYFLLLVPVLLSAYVSAEEPVSSVKKLTGVHKHIPTLLDKYAKLETDFSELKDIIQKFKELGVMPEAEVAPPVLTTEAPGIHSSSAHDRLKALSSMWHKSHASDGGETSIDDQESPAAAPKPAASVSLQSALDMLRARLQKPHSIADQLAEEQEKDDFLGITQPMKFLLDEVPEIPDNILKQLAPKVPEGESSSSESESVHDQPAQPSPQTPEELLAEIRANRAKGIYTEIPDDPKFDVIRQRFGKDPHVRRPGPMDVGKRNVEVPVDRSGYHTVKRRSADGDNKVEKNGKKLWKLMTSSRRSPDEMRRHRLSKAGKKLRAKVNRYKRFKKEKRHQKRSKRNSGFMRKPRGKSPSRMRSKRSMFMRFRTN